MVPLPIALYSLLLHIFVPEAAVAKQAEDPPFFIYEASPTFCLGLVAAFDLGIFQYIIPSPVPDDLPAQFDEYLQELLLQHVPEENLSNILDSFDKVHQRLQAPKATGTPKKGMRKGK